MKPVQLRQWNDQDREPLAQMNADPEVMRYFLSPMSRRESAEALTRMRADLEKRGWGIWAVEVEGRFAGMVGLNVPRWELPFQPCTEILWRFQREFWGQGVAFAAAAQALEYGFSRAALHEIVAFTTPPNSRSIRLMERLGFLHDSGGDFDHPAVPEGHGLRRHVLYRKKNPGTPAGAVLKTRG
ncbi:MAG: GNAT family N-acetyltransferase [Verrucomicrobiota bacterium]